MTSLYHDVGSSADGLASPLLGKSSGDPTRFNVEDSESTTTTPQTSTTSVFELDGDDESKTCCTQLLRSVVAVLIAAGAAAAAIVSFVYAPSNVQPIAVYVMGGICLLNAIIMVKNEKTFLNSVDSRRSTIELVKARNRLASEVSALTDKVEIIEHHAARCKEAEIKLRGIAEAESSNIDDIVQLVNENEGTLELIRSNIRQTILDEVVGVIINGHEVTQVIDDVKSKVLASKIKAKMEDHGIIFDEERFLHALATNSTIWGAINTVKRLLFPVISSEGNTDMLGKDDIFDMYYLSNTDKRQAGSVYAARAIRTGSHLSLVPSTHHMEDRQANEKWTDSPESDSDIPKRPQNRLREQLHQFGIMSFPYFRETREGPLLFGSLIILTFVNSGINVYFSYLIRDFNTALADKEAEAFYHVMYKFMLSMIGLIPLQVMFRFVRVKLSIAWRKWFTERVLKLYFSNKIYYGLERQSKAEGATARSYNDRKKEMDNPDQRIQEDVASFVGYSLSFFLTIISTVTDLVSFSIILFSIMPELFIAIFLFASLGTFGVIIVGKVLIKLNYESLQREADFRFSLVRIRENAESIAFYGGEKVEERETKRKFIRVIENMTSINFANLRLDFFKTTYYHLVNILPIFVLAHQYFIGLIEFGVIAQARQAFWHILDDFSIIINQFEGITSFMAGIDRLFLFMKAIQELDSERTNKDATVMNAKESDVTERMATLPSDGIRMKEYVGFESSSYNASSPQPVLTIRNLRLTTPDNKRVLVQNLSLSLAKGQNLLIAGVSGAGKSSLLRAIAGLWLNGDGEISRSSGVYFLPQRPYCPPGTLRDQLMYPSTGHGNEGDMTPSTVAQRSAAAASLSDENLLDILNSVDLPDLAARVGDGDPMRGINAVLDWSNTLSLGEQQRLAFGRLLVNRPRLIVMDESTSALDVVAEKKMYTLLKEELLTDTGDPVTYVSVGHRPTLLAYHDLKLLLRDCSGYVSFIPRETNSTGDQESILSSMQR